MADTVKTYSAANASTAKPGISGAIYAAKVASGLTLPTDATTDMSTLTAFTSLGYLSEDGLKNNNSHSYEDIKAWGGDTILTTQTSYEDKFSFTLLEVLKEAVQKVVNGESNVTGTLAAGMTVAINSAEDADYAWVFDMIMNGGHKRRIVVPCAKITERDEISYSDADAIGYGVTITCIPDASGNTHYEYTK